MGIGIISLLILLVIAVVAIPILIRVLGEAAGRDPNHSGGSDNEGGGASEEEQSRQSGPNRG